MPYIPKSVKLTDNNDDIINATLNQVEQETGQVPKIVGIDNMDRVMLHADGTERSLHLIARALDSNDTIMNSFFHNLMNRIIKVVFTTMYYENIWRRFKRGFLEAGDIVEEIAFTLCDPHDYDSTDDREYPKQERPELLSAIHKLNYQKYYKKTINRMKILQAFTSRNGMRDLVEEIIQTMYTSAEYDEYISMKYMLGRYALNGFITPVKIPGIATENEMKRTVSVLKGVSNTMTLLGTEYNKYGLPTSTEKRNQIILINAKFDAQLDSEVLAYAFNIDKADVYGQRVFINEWTMEEVKRMDKLFGSEDGYVAFTEDDIKKLNQVPAFTLDDRFFMVFDYLFEMTDFYNPEKLYWNYWLHTWKILSASPFVNAVMYVTSDTGKDAVTGIEISPTALTISKGSSFQFSYKILSNGWATLQAEYSITGNTSESTKILPDGWLYISTDETAASITVTVSTQGESGEVTAQSVVTIS